MSKTDFAPGTPDDGGAGGGGGEPFDFLGDRLGDRLEADIVIALAFLGSVDEPETAHCPHGKKVNEHRLSNSIVRLDKSVSRRDVICHRRS